MSLQSIMLDQYTTLKKEALFFANKPIIKCELNGPTALLLCDDNAILSVLHLDATDFTHYLRQGKLFDRCAEVKKRSDWSYLIISGELRQDGEKARVAGKTTNFTWSAIQGALLTIQEIGLVVCQIDSELSLPVFLVNLAKRQRTPKRVKAIRDTLAFGIGEEMLLSIPGIGEARMNDLIEYANHSTGEALCALTSGLATTIPGITDEICRKVRRGLGLSEGQYLAVFYDEELTDDGANDTSAEPAAIQQQAA